MDVEIRCKSAVDAMLVVYCVMCGCSIDARATGVEPGAHNTIKAIKWQKKIIQMSIWLGRKITDLMSIDTICGVGVGFHHLILGAGFPEGRKDGFGVMEVVMHDVH